MYDIFSEFSDFFDNFDIFTTYRDSTACPGCGRTYQDFKNKGKFGCAKCYQAFKNPVEQTLKQIHQNTRHTGKIPSTSAAELKLKRRYDELKTQLSKAVKDEDYETAAKLHKELKALGDIN